MDYGYLKFKAQNGKSGIFWEQEKKKPDRKFGYKRKDQRFSIRTNPNDVDLEPEPIKDEDSTPKPNFIERNRQLAVSKNKGKKPTLRPIKKSPTGTMTLTQDQLNAILASVGKVASGEEDNLRISVDSKKNSITIQSPRKSRDDDYYDHNSAESGYDDDDHKYNDDKKDKVVKTKTRNTSPIQEDTTTTIFSLLEEFKQKEKKPTKSTKKELTEDKNRKRDRKNVDDEKDYDSDRENIKERRGRKKETSRETKRDKETHKDRSSERDKSRKQDGSRSRERDRRHRRNGSENERHNRDISPERKSKNYREKNESYENRKNKSKDSENDRHRVTENESDKKVETVEKKVVTPREMAGIPMSLPWKHMTLGERRRLMQARIEAEAAIKEIEKKKYELEEQKKRDDNYSERKEHERNDREREKKDRHRKDRNRYDHDSEQKDRNNHRDDEDDYSSRRKERDRNNHRDDEDDYRGRRKERERDRNNHRDDDDNDHDYRSSRHKKKSSRERRRRYSPEQQDSDDDYNDRDRGKKDSRSHRRNDSPELREKKHRDRRRERTPSDDEQRNYKTVEKSPERADSKPPTGLPPAPKTLTLAERKKLQWEKDRIELAKQYDPWGRPGAGAPIRTRSGNVAADYKTRQEETLRASFEEIEKKKQEQKEALIQEMEKGESQPKVNASQQNVPHAMRSSFMFGQAAPDSDQFVNTKEIERRKWLEELDKQNEEKRLRQLNNKGNNATQETWADKFTSNHKPAGFPDQLKEPPSGYQDPYSPRDKTLDGGRVNSAPTHVPDTEEDKTHIRGQNVFMDPVTKRELEEKRKRLLEHQQAVMEQVQQKQREKQRERELKMKEDMEEERKLQAERDRIQRQFEQEQNKVKMKEVRRQQEVDKLKMAMDEAHESALREKISRRLQHLDEGGHDTSHLKATLQDNPQSGRYLATDRESFRDHNKSRAKLTPRNNNPSTYVQPEYIPGLNLELSPRTGPTHRSHREAVIVDNPPYTENRVLTPSQFRHGNDASREFGTQTGMGHYTPPTVSDDKIVNDTDLYEKVEFGTNTDLGTNREESEVQIMYNTQGKRVRVKSAAKEETKKYQRKPEPPVEKKSKPRTKEEKEKEKPKWNFQNKRRKKPVKQSEKDLNFVEKRKQSEMRRLKREQELLNLVNMNRDRIPTERPKGAACNSRGHSPVSDHEGHRSRSIERFNASRRSKSHSPENISARRHQTYRTHSPNLTQRSSSPGQKVVESSRITARGRSPPVPALRYKKDNAYDVQLAERSARKYADNDPLEIPLTDGNFVPFLRTVEVLDPARASSPLHISREPTAVVNARKAYIKSLKPGEYGRKADPYEDRLKVTGEEKSKDPIINPALVTDHPTNRQDAILQQLSSLKMNLMQRRRELETFSPTDFE
ncbi:trichohyalin-like isoform X2 [Pecten maximus]|uniref:trichohyalin-like isoform X2 n=1 Tax=Pecten maximus TaxID=6579 RepID=UPI001458CF43|nr:trichohyalin-like isoform X2 [Pecten maximus]